MKLKFISLACKQKHMLKNGAPPHQETGTNLFCIEFQQNPFLRASKVWFKVLGSQFYLKQYGSL